MSQRDAEWILDRLGRVTASRFADAMAKPESRRYQDYKDELIDERIGLVNFEDWVEKPWFKHGKEMEARAIASYAFYIGGLWPHAELVTLPKFIKHPDPTIKAGCSPDLLIRMNGRIIGGTEIKCRSGAEQQWKAITNGIESVYRPQVQGGMWVVDTQWWHTVSYCEDERIEPEHRLHVEMIARDNAYIRRIEEAVRRLDAEVEREANLIIAELD